MKKLKTLMLMLIMAFSFALVSSCCDAPKENSDQQTKTELNNDKQASEKQHEQTAKTGYQCPMKCEGDKIYSEMGKCPECKMDLEEVKN